MLEAWTTRRALTDESMTSFFFFFVGRLGILVTTGASHGRRQQLEDSTTNSTTPTTSMNKTARYTYSPGAWRSFVCLRAQGRPTTRYRLIAGGCWYGLHVRSTQPLSSLLPLQLMQAIKSLVHLAHLAHLDSLTIALIESPRSVESSQVVLSFIEYLSS